MSEIIWPKGKPTPVRLFFTVFFRALSVCVLFGLIIAGLTWLIPKQPLAFAAVVVVAIAAVVAWVEVGRLYD